MGIFDQFISARLLDRYPQLYQLGQKGQFVSAISMWLCRFTYWLRNDSSKWAVSGPGSSTAFTILCYFTLFQNSSSAGIFHKAMVKLLDIGYGELLCIRLSLPRFSAKLLWLPSKYFIPLAYHGFLRNWQTSSIWTKYHVMAIPGSMLIWMGFLPVYATVAPKLGFSMEYTGIYPRLITSPVFWAMLLVMPCLALSRDFAWK